jgi:DNA-binding transcriptional ArsR family regulator
LVTEWIGGELIVYDDEAKVGHCLTGLAAQVFSRCSGSASAAEIATDADLPLVEVERALVELREAGLLEEPMSVTCRQFGGRLTRLAVSAAALTPLVYSVDIAPAFAVGGASQCGGPCSGLEYAGYGSTP